jgi:exopolyphosphatase/guanosine-5'-triphosphate,3'-diphosphate pyrophosphatase
VSGPASAALDIGSNSVHLLVARPDADGRPVTLLDVSHQAGIGRTVDTTGDLGKELLDMILATLEEYLSQARAGDAGVVVVLGTEGLRHAADATDLGAALHARTGVRLTIVDRATEGLLTLLGVTGGHVPRSIAAIDIGGGSTEVTVAHPDGPPVVGVLPVGSARLAAAHVHHDPVTHTEVRALREAAREHAARLDVPRADRGVVAGGSGTNISRLLGRERTTPVDGAAIEAALDLLRTRPAEILAARTGLTVRRVSQLAAGIAIGEALLQRLGLDRVDVSDASLREGALLATWVAGDDWLASLPAIVGSRPSAPPSDRAASGQDRAS